VGGEADAERLDPGGVTAHGGVALADEVGVDVEVGLRVRVRVVMHLGQYTA
jgi:hypothetical protein